MRYVKGLIYAHCTAVILFLFLPAVLFAGDYPVYLDVAAFKTAGCDYRIGEMYSTALSGHIGNESGFSLKIDEALKSKSPVYKLTGRIKFIPVKKDGKTITKYISEEEEKGGRYVVVVNIIDSSTGKAGPSYDDEFNAAGLLHQSARKISLRIINYYRNNPPQTRLEEGKKTEPVKSEKPVISLISTEIAAFVSVGTGDYRDYNRIGSGLGAAATMNIRGLFLKPSLDSGYNTPGNENIKRALTVRSLLNIGYFSLQAGSFSAAPFIGAGMIYHNINADDKGVNKSYDLKNFILNISLSFDYKLNEKFVLFCSPKYNIFFEKSGKDMYYELGIGVKWLH